MPTCLDLTDLQTHVNTRQDFYLPFREHRPSHRNSRGPQAAFDPSHSNTRGGLFSGLIFRGITFASPFAIEAATTFFSDPGSWQNECAKFPHAPANFFCNPWAYSARKSKRTPALVDKYWEALLTPGCPDWERLTLNRDYGFISCYNFLRESNPSRFQEIGSLAGFLLASDFVYAGVVQAPTVVEVGTIIRNINKGGVRGLELLGLISARQAGSGRSSSWKMADSAEVQAGFAKLYGFLDSELTAAQKAHMVFDGIMVENSLCKLSRVHRENVFVI
ncbi:hypothetical protein C8R45DRAFT_850913 [Mycena sanguinolenta]|nr:hypothetical protein C8R45DRAFT_850913 [Mycena sanguinolenta]